VRSDSVVDYAHWGGLVDDNVGDLPGLIGDGVVGCKAFMCDSGVDFARVDDDVLYAGLEAAGAPGSVVAVHAGNEHVIALLGKRLRDSGRTDRASWHESRPPAAEVEAIRRACHWAKAAGGNLHVVHVTVAEGLEEFARARRDGYRNKHSAYVGCSFRGSVERTIVRGETVFLDGEITVEPRFGRLLRRERPYEPPPFG
jgi:allantoinase